MSTTYMVPLKGGEIYPSHVSQLLRCLLLLLLPQLFLELGLFWFLCAGTVLKLDGVKLLLGALELCIYKVRQYPAIWGKSHLHRHPRWGYVPFLQVLPHRPPICVLPSSAPRPPSSRVPTSFCIARTHVVASAPGVCAVPWIMLTMHHISSCCRLV